jgi:single-strand DNA-binding protein|tara:strand:+ start:19946 stop:20308 length:363 start_codon:yes stop_codon:yes gene_type:complete
MGRQKELSQALRRNDMNHVILSGRVGETPSQRAAVTSFSLATSINKRAEGKAVIGENGHPEQYTEWHRITCFNGLAETIAKHVEKGKKLTVIGRIHYSRYEKDGVKHSGTEIIAEQIEFG